jgi:hypothetical protein
MGEVWGSNRGDRQKRDSGSATENKLLTVKGHRKRDGREETDGRVRRLTIEGENGQRRDRAEKIEDQDRGGWTMWRSRGGETER